MVPIPPHTAPPGLLRLSRASRLQVDSTAARTRTVRAIFGVVLAKLREAEDG